MFLLLESLAYCFDLLLMLNIWSILSLLVASAEFLVRSSLCGNRSGEAVLDLMLIIIDLLKPCLRNV